MTYKTLRPTPQDRLYQPKRKLRKGNTYTRSRNKLEEVVNVLSASCKAEKQELEDAAAQELALLDFVGSQELLLLHLSGLAAVPGDAAAAAAAAARQCRRCTFNLTPD